MIGAGVALFGAFVLLGWGVGSALLIRVARKMPPLEPNAALGLICGGLALFLLGRAPVSRRKRWLALIPVILIILLGLLTIAEYLLNTNLGIDSILFREAAVRQSSAAPSRPAFLTALSLLLLGLAILVLDYQPRRGPLPAQFLALLAILVALLALLGYAAGVPPFYGVFPALASAGMALHFAIAVVFLGAGIIAARPDRGLMAIFLSRGPDGTVARRLILVPVVLPLATGLLRNEGQRRGLYDASIGGWFFSMANIAIFALLIWWIASVLHRSDAARMQAAHRLQESTTLLQDLYDNAPCGYHSVDPDGVVLAMNQTELAWLGYSSDEVIRRRKFADLVSPGSQEAYRSGFHQVQAIGSVMSVELELLRKDGTHFPVLVSSTSVRDSAGRFSMSRTMLTDLTERKKAEEVVRQLNAELEERVRSRTADLAEANRELKHKNDEIEMFVYSVSHDLRSPLVNLQGFTAELGKGCKALAALLENPAVPDEVRTPGKGLLDGKMAKSLGFIGAAVTRLDDIINALLRLSRAGRVEYRWERVDVRRVVARVLDSMQAVIAEKSVAVSVGDLPPVWGDTMAIEQVFANLIGNALNYMDPTRPGRIEVGHRPATGADGGGTTYFVKDNGLGIAENYREKIFQVFQRVHPGVGKGEGIGLAIVARVVERHHGRVWVESRVGEGSTFNVVLQDSPV